MKPSGRISTGKVFVTIALFALALAFSAGVTAETGRPAAFSLYYPESLAEQFGEGLFLDKIPERIVVMTPNPVLAMYEMGIDMLAVPVSQLNQWPEGLAAEQLPIDRTTVDMEGIMMMEPDFVILSTGKRDTTGKALEEFGIPCYYTLSGPSVTFGDIREMIRLLGEAFGKTEVTDRIMADFDAVEARAARYKASHEARTAAVLLSNPGAYMQGSQSYLGGMLDMMGYTNIADTNGPASSLPISMEDLILANPQSVFVTVPSAPDPADARAMYEDAFKENGSVWGKLDAVAEDRVVYMGAKYSHASGLNVLTEFTALMDLLEESSQNP
ncbi:MAG: ABC transporter substrate-binding protein [Oscillospiraceae bacterium]|jgi:iron complex transport system substrate-binding protein|nr:ABC transporter substrate-binding protein [Oscillospiraceae bacterium]